MPTAPILQATHADFPRLALENTRRRSVVVDFWSPSAGPSIIQRDMLSALARDLESPAADELVARVDADPDDHASRFRLAAAYLANDACSGCLQVVIAILRRDDEWQNGRACRALLAVFELLGPEHELVRAHRNELSSLVH